MIETMFERLYRLYNVDCRITAEGVMNAYYNGLITKEEAEIILGRNIDENKEGGID